MGSNKLAAHQIESYGVHNPGEKLEPFLYTPQELGPFDIEVQISHCGICHSDLHLIDNDWGNALYPLVPGHEIIGEISRKGSLMKQFSIGDRVGIGWQRSSCGDCEWCHEGEENMCAEQEATCLGHFGGFAKEIVVDSRFAFAIPQELASENAAPLLCGGATVFSPLLEHRIDGRARVGVVGIGGLGHLAIQFARAFGCEVTAFSSSSKKEAEAKEFGAKHFISSQDPEALAKAASSLDLILFTSSHSLNLELFMQTLRPKGKLCLLGVPKGGMIQLPMTSLIFERKTVCGSNIGSVPAIEQMLRFAALHGIVAKTELFPMDQANRALEKLARNEIHYRAVLKN